MHGNEGQVVWSKLLCGRTQRFPPISPIHRRSCAAESASDELSKSGQYEAVVGSCTYYHPRVQGLYCQNHLATPQEGEPIYSADLEHPQSLVTGLTGHAVQAVSGDSLVCPS